MIKFLDLKSQYDSIKEDMDCAMQSVIDKSAFIGGEFVSKFESEFAEWCGVKHCVAVGNGTDAIEIAIEALKLPVNSEIIVPANSFIASSEAVTRSGHKVVFCDVDPSCYTMSIEAVRKKITEKTRAIIAVHLYGHPCDMGGILGLAKEFNLKVIEDCAQAHGAEYQGKKVGGFGDFATFSFFPGKNLGAYGDGGAILTNNSDLALFARKIANHGRIGKYDHDFEGRNSRLDGLQAAVLSVKLKHLDKWTNHRIKVADIYLSRLNDIPELVLPERKTWAKQVYHLFVIRTKARDALQAHLSNLNIQTGIHYPIALPKLAAYNYLGQGGESFFANEVDTQLLSIPIGEHVSIDKTDHSISDVDIVINGIRSFFNAS